jgi:hypothetical protein
MHYPQTLNEAFGLLRQSPPVPKEDIDVSSLPKDEFVRWCVMTTTADEMVCAQPLTAGGRAREWFRVVRNGEGEDDGRKEA